MFRGTAAVVGVVLVALVVAGSLAAAPASQPGTTLPGLRATPPPWPAERAALAARLAAIGLPALREEGTALHTHQHLDVFVDRRRVAVPAGIGIDEHQRSISPIHTHDATGIIHVESPVVQTFTLGQLFDIWGVRLDGRCLGASCVDGRRALDVFVNGVVTPEDPRAIPLTPRAEIVLAYGTPQQRPTPVPRTYELPSGF